MKMMEEVNKRILQLAIDKYGIENQFKKAIEEMAELTCLLAREKERVDIKDLVTEIADVRIMVEQLSMIVGEKYINTEIDGKIARLHKRIISE